MANNSMRTGNSTRVGSSQRPGGTQRPSGSQRPGNAQRRRAKQLKRYKKLFMFIGTVLGIILAIVLLLVLLIPGKDKEDKVQRTDKEIVLDYIANQDKEYTDDEKKEIVVAYKTMLETDGEDAVDEVLSQDDQTAISMLGMTVNEYVFRDFKKYGYLNSDNSFIDVEGYKTIAGFDVNAATGVDGLADLENVEIVIDGQLCTTVDLREEIADFLERFKAANETTKTTTIYGVDMVDADENTRLYITYLDVQYDDSWNVAALRVSGHLLQK